MTIDEHCEPFEGKLVPLGHIVVQSQPLTQAEGDFWLNILAKNLPAELFSHYSWLPILPGDSN
jgi:hypothetical protein